MILVRSFRHFNSVLLLLAFAIQLQAEQCYTPNNEQGKCVPLYSCPLLLEALSTRQDPSTIQFVEQSNCGGTPVTPLVCCGSSSNFTLPKKNRNETVSKEVLLPSERFCGYQHSDDYFHKNNQTEISEFPWLARIMDKYYDPKCTGSLITVKYVLTSSSCLKRFKSPPVRVRLGEYFGRNRTDCTKDVYVTECSTPVEDFFIERIIQHSNNRNDIALIRLNATVEFTDYIRPICLPLPGRTLAKVEDTLFTSGWSITNYYDPTFEVPKKRITSTLITNEECQRILGVKKINITENYICTMQHVNNTIFGCDNDDGGPVMFSHKTQWHQEGIKSFRSGCNEYYSPEVHTKVANYLDWIKEHVEP